MLLQGQTILVTGSTSGIGLKIAEHLVDQGALVVFHSQNALNQVPHIQVHIDAGHHYVQADLTNALNAIQMVDTAWELTGGLDTLICNAGIYNEPTFTEVSVEALMTTYQVNVFSVFLGLQRWSQLVIKNSRKGSAIMTTSINADLGEFDHSVYDSTKSAVNGLIRSSSLDLAKNGIRVNGVSLGLLPTPPTIPYLGKPGITQFMNRVIPLGLTQPEDVAARVQNRSAPLRRVFLVMYYLL